VPSSSSDSSLSEDTDDIGERLDVEAVAGGEENKEGREELCEV